MCVCGCTPIYEYCNVTKKFHVNIGRCSKLILNACTPPHMDLREAYTQSPLLECYINLLKFLECIVLRMLLEEVSHALICGITLSSFTWPDRF